MLKLECHLCHSVKLIILFLLMNEVSEKPLCRKKSVVTVCVDYVIFEQSTGYHRPTVTSESKRKSEYATFNNKPII